MLQTQLSKYAEEIFFGGVLVLLFLSVLLDTNAVGVVTRIILFAWACFLVRTSEKWWGRITHYVNGGTHGESQQPGSGDVPDGEDNPSQEDSSTR